MAEVSLTKGHAPVIIEEASELGVLRNQLAYLLATSEWETNRTQEPVREAYWLSEAWREANLRYYPWYGRGFVQLTWKDNYIKAQSKLGLGTTLTDNPDAALDPVTSALVLIRGCLEGWFTGHMLSDYVNLSKSDFINARRVVNGTDRASEIADLAKKFDALLLEADYGVEKPSPPTSDLEEMYYALEQRIAALEKWRKS